jgi:OOP family OmpA-OmpF porin
MKLRSASATVAALLLAPAAARAQSGVESGWALDRFDPAPQGDGTFLAEHPRYARRWGWAAGLTMEYAAAPLTLQRTYADTHSVDGRVIASMLVAHLGASVSFVGRVGVDFELPISLLQTGTEALLGTIVLNPSDASVGDARLGARVRLVGRATRDPISVHLGTWLWLPTGSRTGNTGDGAFRVEPRLILAGAAGIFRWSLTTSVMFRRSIDALNVAVGRELRFTAGASFALLRGRLRVGPEAYVVTPIRSLPDGTASAAFASGQWGMEALAGAQLALIDALSLGASVGFGIQDAVGVPSARVALSLTWRPGDAADAVAGP